MKRKSEKKRKTKETDIVLRVDLDGEGEAEIDTGIQFLNHLLKTLSLHAGMDLEVKVEGDLGHHIIEDTAICLGEALRDALGDREGLKRFGSSIVAMEDALARTAIDLAERPYAYIDLKLSRKTLENVAREDLIHFLRTMISYMRVTLHVEVLRGENDHHKVEASFKSIALSLRDALSPASKGEAMSLKGVL